MTSDRSVSLPQLSVITAEGEEQDAGEEDQEDQAPVISPLTPKLTPTFRAQSHLSPFWFSTASASPELAQVTGSTSASPAPPPPGGQGAPLSMLHAAAITGNTEALEKLASGNFCDIDLRDKFGRTPLMYAVLGNYPECVDILVSGIYGLNQNQLQEYTNFEDYPFCIALISLVFYIPMLHVSCICKIWLLGFSHIFHSQLVIG